MICPRDVVRTARPWAPHDLQAALSGMVSTRPSAERRATVGIRSLHGMAARSWASHANDDHALVVDQVVATATSTARTSSTLGRYRGHRPGPRIPSQNRLHGPQPQADGLSQPVLRYGVWGI